jgi:hypothetical protein
VNCDQAHGLLGLERAEAFLHLAGGQAVAARADQFDADQVAILRAAGVSGRNGEFAAGLLLVDGDHAAVAIWHQAEDSENAVGGLVEQFDHAAAIGLVVFAVGLFNAQQGAIANTGNGAGRCTARHMDPNNRGGPSTSSSHSAGAASSSPSLSRPVTSATMVGGSDLTSRTFLPCLAIAPSSASSRKIRRNAARIHSSIRNAAPVRACRPRRDAP